MYPVTQAYTNAIRALSRTDRLTGLVTFTVGDDLTLDESNIGQGSVSISRQCVDNEEIQFGTASLGQLRIDIRTNVSRYKFFGAKIELTYGIMTANGWFDIPLGIFTVGEAERKGETVQIRAYDNLIKLDEIYDGTILYGTAYDLLSVITDLCGVSFGMTKQSVESLPNGRDAVQIDSESGCSTYRDCAKIIAQMLGCFIVANTDGSIVLKQYGNVPVTIMGAEDRYSLNLADYICQYSGIIVQSSTAQYYASDSSISGNLEMYISDAPAWDFGLPTVLQNRTEALLDVLKQISYTPCGLTTPGDPAIECGDVIQLTTNDGTVNTLVTGITWKFRGRMTIESAGVNPFLNTQKKKKTQITRELERQTESKNIIYYAFTNAAPITVQESDTAIEISKVTLVTATETNAVFLSQIPIESILSDGTSSIILEIMYYVNGISANYTMRQTLFGGHHLLCLFYPLSSLQANINSTFSVRFRIVAGSGTINIAQQAVRATISGQGLASTDTWNGNIDFEELYPAHSTKSVLGISSIQEDDISVTQTDLRAERSVTENTESLSLRSALTIKTINETVTLDQADDQP